MIPLKDYIKTRRFPVVSFTLIAINITAFLVDKFTGHYVPVSIETSQGIVKSYQFIGGLKEQYALVPVEIIQHFSSAWVTIFTSMFMHGSWLHIGSNMLYLWIFGNNVEDTLGRFRFLIFYLTCGCIAAIVQILSCPYSEIPMIGASGAVAGVMGAYLIFFPHSRILTIVPIFFFFTFFDFPALLIIGYWVLIQFINATWLGGGEMLRAGGVAYFAHIGGFITGILWVLLDHRNIARMNYR
jgi:membrane associated rhomboid family serine protease